MSARAFKYWAFISYSHCDAAVARALHRTLESYRVPKQLVGVKTAAGEIPARLKPVFLDRDELQAGTDLQSIVRDALAQSRYLIVVCSPEAARSPWVQQEIIEFKKMHGESRVLAAIASGEPFASRFGGHDDEECFPLPLRAEVTSSGFADGRALEPIAADFRSHADGRRRGTLKLIAGMIGVGADELIRRDAKRRMRQLAVVATGSLAGMAAMTVLAVNAVRARDEAQRQRGEAEVLLEFMLGDLRTKLLPVGRLEVLDGVGEQALAYYARQDSVRLDADALGRRSRAFHLIGELDEQRGQLEAAQIAFQRAAETTERLLARAPHDPQRIFDHAQSVYWVGHLAWLRGQAPAAEQAFRHYTELADMLARKDPTRGEWQAETAYARVNVGVVCLNTGRIDESLELLGHARATWLRLIPQQPQRGADLGNCLGWIAKAHEAQGALARALETQQEKMNVLAAMPDAQTNQQIKRSMRVIHAELARLELALGHVGAAEKYAMTAVEAARALTAIDPRNNTWLEQLYIAQVILAEVQLAAGDRRAARETCDAAGAGAAKLLAADPKVASWQVNLRGSVLALAAELARPEERWALTDQLLEYLRIVAPYLQAPNQARDIVIAKAQWRLGALLDEQGRRGEALTHWRAVVARLRRYVEQNDYASITWLAMAQAHLGAMSEARSLAERLEASPYRHPAYADLLELVARGAEPLATTRK